MAIIRLYAMFNVFEVYLITFSNPPPSSGFRPSLVYRRRFHTSWGNLLSIW